MIKSQNKKNYWDSRVAFKRKVRNIVWRPESRYDRKYDGVMLGGI